MEEGQGLWLSESLMIVLSGWIRPHLKPTLPLDISIT